jgi:hypothetical protein
MFSEEVSTQYGCMPIFSRSILSSVMLFGMGIMGFYMSKMFDEIKGRPKYIIRDKTDNL